MEEKMVVCLQKRILDFGFVMFFYAFQRNWDDTLKAFNISNEELLIRRTGIKRFLT